MLLAQHSIPPRDDTAHVHTQVHVPIVTGSAKTGLITLGRKVLFLSQTQRHINTLSSFTAKVK